jgi:hypothetical protein
MAISNNSTGLRPGVCTSTTRPSAPYEGQHIYETDTDLEYVWNGSAWVINYVQAASPAFTGTPTAPTATAGTNTTQLATTEFVATAAANVTSGFRNVLINGDMRINQRGGSYTSVGYTLDRWYLGVNTSHTISQSTSTPPAGFQNFMRVQRTNGSTSTTVPQIAHNLETSASIPLQGKVVTVSFYARAGANYSATSNAFNWRIYGGTGTDQNIFSYTGPTIVVDQSVTLTTSWQRFTYTTTALTSYNEYGLFLFSVPTGTAGAADYVDITGVQLEVGPQATPFEQRPIGVELELCQRYYQRMVDPVGVGVSQGGTGGSARVTVPLYTKMRAVPTSTMSGTFNFYNGLNTVTATYIAASQNSFSHGQFDFPATFSGPTQGQAIVLYTTGGSQYLDFSAEL